MSSLANCIKKAGKLIPPSEAKMIERAVAQYRKEGYGPNEAAIGAVRDIINDLNADLEKIHATIGVLGTPADELEQKAIPQDKMAAVIQMANAFISEGINTPQQLAAKIDSVLGPKARKFSESIWDAFGIAQKSLRGTHDWRAIYSAADKETSLTDQQPQSKALTELAPVETGQGPRTKKPDKIASKSKFIGVGLPASGNPDILNAIEEIAGGVTSRDSVKNPGGEYDGFSETFTGTARLLIRKNGGQAIDQVARDLHEAGFLKDGYVETLRDAVTRALANRKSEAKAIGRREYEDRFERAFLGNQHPREWLRSGNKITVDDLNAGDTFTVEGEKFEVKDVDEEGNVTIKDGITRVVPPGTPVFPDKGKIKRAKSKDFFADAERTEPAKAPEPAPAAPGELFGAEEMPFNLAGTEQPDGARLLQERIDREDAKREQDKLQTRIPGTETKSNEPSTDTNLERDSNGKPAGDGSRKADVSAERDAARPNTGELAGVGSEQQGGTGSDTGSAVVSGEESDSALPERQPGQIESQASTPGGKQSGGSGAIGGARILDDAGADTAVDSVAPKRPSGDVVAKSRERSLPERVKEQRRAENIPIVVAELSNIAETLPVLLPEQHDDVLKAERRMIQEDKRGILFTNGTGTGKTFTGLGIVKRMVRRGATSGLVVVPQSKKAVDWQHDARHLGLEFSILEDTKTAGAGLTITTYANFRTNDALKNRDFDFVVYDESHKLVQNEEGGNTSGLQTHRFVTNHPDFQLSKAEERVVGPRPVYPSGQDNSQEKEAYYEANEAWMKKRDTLREEIDRERQRINKLTKAIFLSATPFAYHKTLSYGEGYLFDIPKSEGGRAYNQAGGFDQFLVENFGYRMRYNKLTIPESGVDMDLMERMFADRLMKEGAVSGRMIDVPYDYSREFVLVDPGLGSVLDKGISVMMGHDDHDTNKWTELPMIAKGRFPYHYVQQLMEAIKVAQGLDRIREHIALGRKIILFHNYVNAEIAHPFRDLEQFATTKDGLDEIKEFNERYPQFAKTDFGKLANPLALLKQEFGDSVVFFNGNVSDKNKLKAVDDFNDDTSPVKIIVAQSDSMKEGVSAHDTTGKVQRVVMNVGLPIKPTDAIQEEGRAYRVGVMSNAIYEYLVIHTNTEKYAFGSKINLRVRTAENLALGSMARNLQDSFKNGYVNPVAAAPDENQGKGGKDADRRAAVASPFDRAKSFYFGRQKKTSKNKSAEGVDYFATPEPIGFKMVEWAKAVANERMLEPSAGHGAIARFFPNFTTNHYVEPSIDLANELRIKVESGATDVMRFEDFNLVNKFDAVVLNPPFGSGGSTAIKHLAKAALHLKDGGRIIALIPEGPAADDKFAKWYEGSDSNLIKVAEFGLPNVTFERAGTSVKTRIVVIDRIDNQNQRSEARVQGRVDIDTETVNELFDRIEHLNVPPRTEPVQAVPNPLTNRNSVLPATAGAQVGDYASEEFKHTKTGKPIYVAKPTRFLGTGFQTAKQAAIRAGGRYSAFKGAGAIPGFHFDTAQARDLFIDQQRGKSEDSGYLGTPAAQLSPQLKNIKNKVIGTLEDKRNLLQKTSDYLSEFGDWIQNRVRQHALDSFYSLLRLEKLALGTNQLDASIGTYKWARLTTDLPAVVESWLKDGPKEFRNGSFHPIPGKKGLLEILKPVADNGNLEAWELYVAAFRADRLLEEGKEKNFGKYIDPQTGEWAWSPDLAREEINAALELGRDNPEFETVRQEYVDFQDKLLNVATATGAMDPNKRALWQRSDYVPFYRIVEALDGKDGSLKGPGKRRGFSGQKADPRQLKGGPQPVAIIENIYRNLEMMLDASFKEEAMRRIFDLASNNTDLMVPIPYKAVPFKTNFEEVVAALEKSGVDTSALTTPELEEIVTFWRMRAPEGKDVVSSYNFGKPKYARVKDKELLSSILALGPEKHALWMKILMAPKHGLTNLVTMAPPFIAANTFRDTLSTWVISGAPIKPGWDAGRGFIKSMKNDPTKLAIMANGGGSGHYNRMKDSEVRNHFLRMTKSEQDGFAASVMDSPAKLWRFYKEITRASENANRIAIADTVLKEGGSPAEAAYQAKDIMDFGLRGDSKSLAFFLNTVPFLNARIQGLYRLSRSVTQGDSQEKIMGINRRFATHGALLALATLGILASNWDDDRYWALQEWDRDAYYHFWIGDRHIRLPKPFEVGQIFSTFPERMMQVMAKDGNFKVFGRQILHMIDQTFFQGTFYGIPVPQAIKPVVDVETNKSSMTGRPIISAGDEYKSPEQQYSAFTSTTAREIANAMPNVAPEMLRSPKQLEYLIRGYFGTIGMYALEASDAMLRPSLGYPDKPEGKTGDNFLIKRFMPEDDIKSSKFVGEFYDLHRDIMEINAKVKSLRENGDLQTANQVTQENRAALQYAPIVKSTAKALTDIRKRERQVYESRTMSPQQKREELGRLTQQSNRLAETAVTRRPNKPQPFVTNPFR